MLYYLFSYKVGNYIDSKLLESKNIESIIDVDTYKNIIEKISELVKSEYESKSPVEKISYAIMCGDINNLQLLSITNIYE